MSLGNIFIHRLNKNSDGSICSLLRDISLGHNPFFRGTVGITELTASIFTTDFDGHFP